MLANSNQLALDLNMIAAGLLLSLVAGLIAGIYPAWKMSRSSPALALREE